MSSSAMLIPFRIETLSYSAYLSHIDQAVSYSQVLRHRKFLHYAYIAGGVHDELCDSSGLAKLGAMTASALLPLVNEM